MTAMIHERHGAFLVVCHSPHVPPFEAWEAFVDACIAGIQAGDLHGILVFTQGGGPDTMQRRHLEMTMRIHRITAPPPSAIITDAWAARQIARIVSWFVPTTRCFASREIDQAMDFLQVPAELCPELLRTAVRLQEQVASAAKTS